MIDAVRNWATRRERVTYYAAATLIEFGSTRRARPGAGILARRRRMAAPIAVAERFLLVEDERTDPVRPPPPDQLARLSPARRGLRDGRARRRLAGARPGALGPSGRRRAGTVRRRAASARAGPRPDDGAGTAAVRGHRRVVAPGHEPGHLPAAARRVVRATDRRRDPARRPAPAACARHRESRRSKAARMVVLNLPSVELLDGLLQHPATSPLLGDRLGPTSVAIPDDQMAPLQKVLKELGIHLELE